MQFVSTTSCDVDGILLVVDAMFVIDLNWKDDGDTTCCKKSNGLDAQQGIKKLSL
jgi:hypothetical protein